MSRPAGNTRLKNARLAAGYNSQQALADAMSAAAKQLGLAGLEIGVRQIRRWESETPPWPQADAQRVLTHLLGQSIEQLGFTPPWGIEGRAVPGPARRSPIAGTMSAVGLATVPTVASTPQPASVGIDYAAITIAHRRLYWTAAPAQLHPAIAQHARLGCHLLPDTAGACHRTVAAALAESYLLAGRIEFFDLQQPVQASETLVQALQALQALQAAGEADDPLLGAAILAHTAFIPGWAGRRDEAAERMVAARTYARRGHATPAVPGSPAEDGLRLLAGLGADSGDAHPTANAQVREQLNDAHPPPGTPQHWRPDVRHRVQLSGVA